MKHKKAKVLKCIYISASLAVIFASITVIISNCFLTVTHYDLNFKTLPSEFDRFRIVQISDLHNVRFSSQNKSLLNKVMAQNADIVVLTGDMICAGKEDKSGFLKFAQQLACNCSTYYVDGNHEQAMEQKSHELFIQQLESLGITVLNNKSVKLEKNSSSIQIYGLVIPAMYYADRRAASNSKNYFFSLGDMQNVFKKRQNEFSILLTHNPVYFYTYAYWGADLTLCGHLHGGMVRTINGKGIFSPEKTLFPKYDSGVFENNSKIMVVSRGLGNGNLGFRLLNCPEIVSITINQGGRDPT